MELNVVLQWRVGESVAGSIRSLVKARAYEFLSGYEAVVWRDREIYRIIDVEMYNLGGLLGIRRIARIL